MSIFDSIGTMFEGGLFARAVEPRAGEAADEGDYSGTCLNCGTQRVGHYCHHCGQSAHIHRSMGAFLHDLLHGALHFEGKTWHTLPLLVTKPGQLTRRYIQGERARFVSPMALFLFSVFLMFAIFQIAGIGTPTELEGATAEIALEGAELENGKQEIAATRESLKEELESLPADAPERAALQSQLDGLDQVSNVGERYLVGGEDGDGIRLRSIRTGSPFLDHGIEKWEKNPALMLYKLQANSYKFSWLLIPLSIPFLWLIFAWKRGFGAYDHAVFVTYSLSFMTLFYVTLTILATLGLGSMWVALAGSSIPIWHIYRQLKGAYGLSRFSAVWRTIVLVFFIFVIISLFVNLLLLLGAMG
ncbi:hypothetical protein FHS61_000540 [Altererythrobacter atlanticus]|uniref:Uncharacterized protein n=1 Tax=Croceibacterium atlanticum TaxID=1267766 RepID=A0A0F7KUB1_9SPHN|nr:DUF3667 domain-containing protein [Croceibacterium atlanticum]AKH42766.1 hypothetical protein WYH_01730 [Croceibacterium atlanticum]MBB5731547.1 hypothetical protein [Croceibacterium atlanticum]